MIAVDTNVLLRFLTRDDEDQAARARQLLADEMVFVPATVLLEAAWVLHSSYGYDRRAIAEALHAVLSVPSVEVEEPVQTRKALDWFAAGLDFADALHLASSGAATEFATFDRRFVQRATKLGTKPPVRHP